MFDYIKELSISNYYPQIIPAKDKVETIIKTTASLSTCKRTLILCVSHCKHHKGEPRFRGPAMFIKDTTFHRKLRLSVRV